MESEFNNQGVATEEMDEQADGRSTASDQQFSVGDIIADRDRLAKEKAELQDLAQRRQAEFDNYRRRNEKERSELADYVAMDTVKALLPVLDDFERALKVETTDREYARGMELIYQRMFEALSRLGLEPISSEVPVFNPHIHHAVEMVASPDHDDQTILAEYQRGYYFKGRLLRPAMVKVAVNS
jgi:molecular chaperone GrpE